MKGVPTRASRRLVVSGPALGALASPVPAEAARKAPTVEQMVVFKSGRPRVKTVKASRLRVKVGSRRRSVRTGTPLAALELSRPGRIGLRSFGGQLYVRSIASNRARGQSGWLYKVGNLTLKVAAGPTPGTATARVRSYDDEGRGRAEAGVAVKVSGGESATTTADGSAVVAATAGQRTFTARKSGSIRSFPVTAIVR